jgi:hypothetical protein
MKTLVISVAVATALTVGGPAGAASCQNLKVDSATKAAIKKAFSKGGAKGTLKAGSLFYGKCGSTYWAAGSFGDTDAPDNFKRKSGGSWKHLGDGGCDPSNHQIPSAMKKVWKLCTS